MAEVDDVKRKSYILPEIEELRDSQRKGQTDRGLEENKTGKLNEAHGHEVNIYE